MSCSAEITGGSLRNSRLPPLRAAPSLVAVVLLLTGCVSGSDQSGSSTSMPTPETVASQDVTTTTETVTTVRTVAPTTTTIPPPPKAITGYGDFSDQDWYYMDPFLATRLVVQCLQDHGFPVKLIPPGDGITFVDVPADQNALADAYLDACRAGLNMPDGTAHPGIEIVEKSYRYLLAVAQCLIAEGHDPPEPPSLEVFADTFMTGHWSPYKGIHSPSAQLLYKCPQYPASGIGNWNVGDGLPPLPPIESYDSP